MYSFLAFNEGACACQKACLDPSAATGAAAAMLCFSRLQRLQASCTSSCTTSMVQVQHNQAQPQTDPPNRSRVDLARTTCIPVRPPAPHMKLSYEARSCNSNRSDCYALQPYGPRRHRACWQTCRHAQTLPSLQAWITSTLLCCGTSKWQPASTGCTLMSPAMLHTLWRAPASLLCWLEERKSTSQIMLTQR